MGAAAGAAAFALPTAYAKPPMKRQLETPTPEPTNTSEATRLSKPVLKKLGVLRLEGWGNPETTGTGVEDPEHATPGHPYTGYVPLPGDVDAMQGQLRRL